MKLLKNITFAIKGHEKHFASSLVLHFCHALLLSIPVVLLVAILRELLAPSTDTSTVWLLVAVMAASFVVQLFVSWYANLSNHRLSFKLSEKLRMDIGTHLYRISLGVFVKHEPSTLSSVISQDVRVVESLFSQAITNVVTSVFSAIILMGFLFWLDFYLASILLLGIFLLFPFVFASDRLVGWLGHKQIKLRGEMASKFLEFYMGMKHLKAFNLTGLRFKSLENSLNEYRKACYRTEMLSAPMVLISFVFCDLAYLAMVWGSLERFAESGLSSLTVLVFLVIGYLAFSPLKALLIDILHLRYLNESLKRIQQVLSIESIDTGTISTPPSTFDVRFDNVTFGYQNDNVLNNIQLNFPQNSITALVGYSGTGKSTILSLIARFYDVKQGKVSIGGTDIRELNLHTLYTCMSEVFQDVYLYDDTIANNVRIGKPDATDAEVIKACEQAQCMEFIDRLSNGIFSRVGEGGARLSGGEKQRIAIARALLKNAPILLLDEATASLDPENELSIQKAIHTLSQNKTVIVVAHKLKTIQSVDNIIVLDKSGIHEQGTHSELMQNQGIYAQMWTLQQENATWLIS